MNPLNSSLKEEERELIVNGGQDSKRIRIYYFVFEKMFALDHSRPHINGRRTITQGESTQI